MYSEGRLLLRKSRHGYRVLEDAISKWPRFRALVFYQFCLNYANLQTTSDHSFLLCTLSGIMTCADYSKSGSSPWLPFESLFVWLNYCRLCVYTFINCTKIKFKKKKKKKKKADCYDLSLVTRKSVLRVCDPGKTQTCLLRYRDELESWNFGLRGCAGWSAHLWSIWHKVGFLMAWLTYHSTFVFNVRRS